MNRRRSHQSRRTHRRGGYVLLLVAMMLFGLFAMAALVIDLGFARVAQRQMQSAADAAALEGLRGRGQGVDGYVDRQANAERFIAWTFADNLDATIGNDGTVDFGAVVNFSGGVGNSNLNASQLMRVDASNVTTIQRRPSSRDDNHFAVAVQRGGVIEGDFDLLAHGPSVPYLFASGSFFPRDRIGNGISVGGVSLTEARPAISVGRRLRINEGDPVDMDGAFPFAISLADWDSLPGTPNLFATSGLQIGDEVSNTPISSPVTGLGFFPIFQNFDGQNRITAFGIGNIADDGSGLVTIPMNQPTVANRNASVVFTQELPEPPLDVQAIVSAHHAAKWITPPDPNDPSVIPDPRPLLYASGFTRSEL